MIVVLLATVGKRAFSVLFQLAKHVGNINSYQHVNDSTMIRIIDQEKKKKEFLKSNVLAQNVTDL